MIALQAGIPGTARLTVNRNCASGMESLLTARQIIREGVPESCSPRYRIDVECPTALGHANETGS